MSDWEYTVGGKTAPTTVRTDAHGEVTSVTVDIDLYGTNWVGDEPTNDSEWDDEREEYYEFGNGATAELRFDVSEGVATLDGFKNINNKPRSDWYGLQWLMLLPAAERFVENVQGVREVVPPEETVADRIEKGFAATVEQLDD